jgi:hypothetical protein
MPAAGPPSVARREIDLRSYSRCRSPPHRVTATSGVICRRATNRLCSLPQLGSRGTERVCEESLRSISCFALRSACFTASVGGHRPPTPATAAVRRMLRGEGVTEWGPALPPTSRRRRVFPGCGEGPRSGTSNWRFAFSAVSNATPLQPPARSLPPSCGSRRRRGGGHPGNSRACRDHRGRRHRRARVHEDHARIRAGLRPDPVIDVVHPRVLVGRRGVVGNDRARDDADAGVQRLLEHRGQLVLHVLRRAPLVDIVHARLPDYSITRFTRPSAA